MHLLQSVAEAARLAFVARAASIALGDAESRELVFAAVSGEGAERLDGARYLARESVAGHVARTGAVVVIDDVGADARFAGAVALETGYVPEAMMVAPVRFDGRTLGVLTVLDAGPSARTPDEDTQLLELLARQAAVAIQLSALAGA